MRLFPATKTTFFFLDKNKVMIPTAVSQPKKGSCQSLHPIRTETPPHLCVEPTCTHNTGQEGGQNRTRTYQYKAPDPENNDTPTHGPLARKKKEAKEQRENRQNFCAPSKRRGMPKTNTTSSCLLVAKKISHEHAPRGGVSDTHSVCTTSMCRARRTYSRQLCSIHRVPGVHKSRTIPHDRFAGKAVGL